MKRVRLFEISVDRVVKLSLSLLLLLVSRFESHRSDISSGSSVNLISATTSNRSFLRLYPHFLANIYVHFTPNNGAHRSRADRSFSSNFSPFVRERKRGRERDGERERDRTAASILRRFPAHQCTLFLANSANDSSGETPSKMVRAS